MEDITIQTEYIKADAFLKFIGMASTGGHAKLLIEESEVMVNGEPCTQRGKKLRTGDIIQVSGRRFRIV